jgi:hypothetical protein
VRGASSAIERLTSNEQVSGSSPLVALLFCVRRVNTASRYIPSSF